MKCVLVLALLVAVVAGQALQPQQAGQTAPTKFSYADPTTWDGVCKTGQAQSPINIDTTATACVRHGEEMARDHRIHFHYIPQYNLSLEHNGNTLKVKGDLGYITLGGCNPCDGQEYYVRQFHFHSPAEHTIDASPDRNGTYQMELHIVHQKRGSTGLDDLVFVTVLFYIQPHGGFPERFLDSLNWNFAPKTAGDKTAISNYVSLHKLSEALKGEYYSYKGSLTTPPCTESVRYFIMKNPLGITHKQARTISDLFANNAAFANGRGNNRPVQPLNNRRVTWYRKRQ